jgi:predicted RNA-binding Zn-ribbon protein involved in translation (DUF1610 family)
VFAKLPGATLYPVAYTHKRRFPVTQAAVPAPSIHLTSFACPHCGAHATQYWYNSRVNKYTGENPVPAIFSEERIEAFEARLAAAKEVSERADIEHVIKFARRLQLGDPFLSESPGTLYNAPSLANVFVSRCHTCNRLSIWLHDRLLYPPTMTGPAPNGDLSADVMRDYEEARAILDRSPRGAAALLRLAVEKICIELGAGGDNINKRIADLVSKGLPEEVQQALDAVRVIGNEAVHPGQLDLRDDRDTAMALFSLVNFIVEDRVTRPRQRSAIYGMIPPDKRRAIEARNAKALDTEK